MGGHDHCCALNCLPDGRSSWRGDTFKGNRISFHHFPVALEERLLWLSRVCRADLTLADVTIHTVLCSLHFHNREKTADQPHPVHFSHANFPLCRKRPSTCDGEEGDRKRRRSEPSSTAARAGCAGGRRKTTSSPLCRQPQSLYSLAMMALAREHNRLRKRERAALAEAHQQAFCAAKFERDPVMFQFYTGLPSYSLFERLMTYLKPRLAGLYLHHGQKCGLKERQEPTPQKIGRPRALSPEQEFFLTLVFLWLGLKELDLAERFGLSSQSQVPAIISTWIPFLAKELGPLLKFPSSEEVRSQHAEVFKSDKECAHVRTIIDCYEVVMERPSSFQLNAMTYSEYKSRNTFKVLVGVTPTGYVSFVSKAFPGAISDHAITRSSEILDKLQAGDALMADKGFTLSASDIQPRGITLILPPFKEGDQQMKPNDVARNRHIANRRMVVENAIGQMCAFDVLQRRLPVPVAGSGKVSDVVKVIAILANFGPPLQ